jgi:MoaA/NifB/PqqE/SkfB family radical SAM enzyme
MLSTSVAQPALGTRTGASWLSSIWLELTGRCQLLCSHCYAQAGPRRAQGSMMSADWMRVIDQAADLGTSTVQMIGGEPLLHPHLPQFVLQALTKGLAVEVYSNLYAVPPSLWERFERPGVSLATSVYSGRSDEHDGITGRVGSHQRTMSNIREAHRRGIPVRVGIVVMQEGQDVAGALGAVRALGVDDVRVDRLRQVGRGVRDAEPGVDQLCGACATGRLAILPDGEVTPCVFARWLVVGNVRLSSLAEIHTGAATVRRELAEQFSRRSPSLRLCPPDRDQDGGCPPLQCDPILKCDPTK